VIKQIVVINRGISLLSSTYKILSNILLPRLIPYAEEINGELQRGLCGNRFTTNHIFWICQMLEKKWEYNEVVYQLFIDVKKANDSVRREVGIIFSVYCIVFIYIP